MTRSRASRIYIIIIITAGPFTRRDGDTELKHTPVERADRHNAPSGRVLLGSLATIPNPPNHPISASE